MGLLNLPWNTTFKKNREMKGRGVNISKRLDAESACLAPGDN